MFKFSIAAMATIVATLSLALGWYADHQKLSSQLRSKDRDLEVIRWRLEKGRFRTDHADGAMLKPIRDLIEYDSANMLRRIVYLGEIDDTRYIPLLIYLLSDVDERTSIEAENSLNKISLRQPIPADISIKRRPVSDNVLVKWRKWYGKVNDHGQLDYPKAPPVTPGSKLLKN